MSACNSNHTSAFEDDEIFDDSTFLANFDNTSFKQTKRPESIVNDSLNTSALNVSALCCDEEICGYDKITGRTWIYPTNYPVRDYQFNIIKAAMVKNTLVSLPTGLGKTFIAAVIMYNFFRWYPLGKIVFTAPTRPLVAQQIDACYNIVAIPPNETIEMTGHMQVNTRKTHWQNKRVFFATPQVVYNDLKSGICPADKIRCLVIDEAHRARGNYAYCQIVAALDDLGLKTYRMLALSATPGSKVEDVINVVKSLHIAHLELRTENCIDVAPYSHARKINTVIIQLGPELTQLRQQYVEILDQYARRLKQLNILPQNLGNLSKGRIVMLYKEYQNKDRGMRHQQHNYIMKDFTLLIALFHGLELLVKHGSRVFLNFFDEHPEKSWIQSDDRLTALLERLRDDLGVNPLALDRSILPDGTIPEIPNNLSFGHPKFDKLKAIMLEHFTTAKMKKQDTKAIVFCEYRESVNLVHCLLLQCRPLIVPQMFVGQGASGKDGKAVVSQKQQLRVMRSFREGFCNVLVATCVAEEGLDVGSVDLILCFDISTRSPVRLVQRCGRTGRERGGQVFLLVTEGREHQTLLDCMRQRDGLNKKIQQSKEVENNLYKLNPRMMPHGFTPECKKMYITVKEIVEKNKFTKKQPQKEKGQKDLRSMLAGRASTSKASPKKNTNTELGDSLSFDEEFQREAMRPEPMMIDEPIVINSQDTPYIAQQDTAVQTPVKTKQAKKKQKVTSKSPAKNYGDIRALFSTATKSTKNYTKIINDLGVNDSGLPTKLINLLVDLNLDNSNTTKTCYICQNICDCKMIKPTEDTNKPVLIRILNEPLLPNLELIDDIDADAIVMCNKSMEDTQVIENISRELSFVSTDKVDKANCSANFDLEFDFDALDDLKSPENHDINKSLDVVDDNTDIVAETNFNLGNIDDIFVDSSPEEAIQKELESNNVVIETKGNPKETEEALGFFGLDSIEDIFADSNDSVIQVSPESSKVTKTEHTTELNKISEEIKKKTLNYDNVPNSAYPLSPSILSGQLIKKRSKSPILCSQLSAKKAKLSSSTPSRSITKQISDFTEDNNVIVIDDDDKSNVVDSTNKSMFTITQLVDMINKTDDKSIRDNLIKDNQKIDITNDEDRSTSPILLTQAERKKSGILNSSKSKTISLNKSLIVLDSDSDDDNDTKLYDFYKEIGVSSAHKNKTINSSQFSRIEKLDGVNSMCKTKDSKDTSKVNLSSKRISFFDAISTNTTELETNKAIDSSFVGCKRKFNEEDSESITASPYFNKKQKIEDATDKPSTLQQKILAAISSNKNTQEIKNNQTALHFTVSQPDLYSQKENTKPKGQHTAFKESIDKIAIRPLDVLHKYKKENKILSLRKKFNTIFKKSPEKSPVNTSPLKTSIHENSIDDDFISCEGYSNAKKSNAFNQKKILKRIIFDNSDDDFTDYKSGPSSPKETGNKNNIIRSSTNHEVRKKKRKNNSLLDLEAALSDSDSGDELTDSSAGSIAEFICDDDVTHHEDIQAIYLKSVRSPVKKNGFKIPELPKKYNQTDVFSQFVAEDAYEMDSFCVDSNVGLTQVHEVSELELAECLLKEKKRRKRRSPSLEQNESPLVKRKYKKINRLNSDSEDSS